MADIASNSGRTAAGTGSQPTLGEIADGVSRAVPGAADGGLQAALGGMSDTLSRSASGAAGAGIQSSANAIAAQVAANSQSGFAKLEIISDAGNVRCQFNPASFGFQKSNEWKPPQSKGLKEPTLKFVSAGSAMISLDLMLDTTDSGRAVTDETDKLLNLLKVQGEGTSAAPPTCRLRWGSYESFEAVVLSVDIKYTFFASNGTPLRAAVKLSLKQAKPDEKALQNPTSGTPTPHRVHTVMPGETLDRIAWRYYGSSNAWRRLAEANGITDPLALEAGESLVVPYVEGMAGAS